MRGRQRVAEVVDQVGEQGNAQRRRVDERLSQGLSPSEGEAPRDGTDTRPRADDRRVDEPVRVPVMLVRVYERFGRPQEQHQVTVPAGVRMAVPVAAVTMRELGDHPRTVAPTHASSTESSIDQIRLM
jgi:hypothetical protein